MTLKQIAWNAATELDKLVLHVRSAPDIDVDSLTGTLHTMQGEDLLVY